MSYEYFAETSAPARSSATSREVLRPAGVRLVHDGSGRRRLPVFRSQGAKSVTHHNVAGYGSRTWSRRGMAGSQTHSSSRLFFTWISLGLFVLISIGYAVRF